MRKCIKCGKQTQIYLPQHRLALCKEDYKTWFESRTERTIEQFKMFDRTEKILVAVSGGKDSLSLWNVLVKLGYNADGLYINLGIHEYSKISQEKVQKFANSIKKQLHIVEIKSEFGKSIPEIAKDRRKPACSSCGAIKRYYMNLYAHKLGYNVIATGHNLDDEVSVLLLNTLSWNVDYLSRQYPVLPEENGFVRKVKPFCKASEKETAMYAVLSNIDYIEDECPYADGSTTINHKKILAQIEEFSPGTKLRFYLEFLSKMYPLITEKKKNEVVIKSCRLCGEPTQSEICSICRMKA